MSGGRGVLVSVEVDAGTVRLGDQLVIGGQVFTVRDMMVLPHGRKRLDFGSGESFTLRGTTVLWAARRVDPRRRRLP
ncbi:hypothetical protein [Streptomyces sp. SBT349]|uniref:hypothetical protein n=1 Tax=Streptomyces sp. SBT349 TaxID=1580539 RepID=UPI00066D33B2|nr:hypothetical protein [Streptomyces sp. SBT349]